MGTEEKVFAINKLMFDAMIKPISTYDENKVDYACGITPIEVRTFIKKNEGVNLQSSLVYFLARKGFYGSFAMKQVSSVKDWFNTHYRGLHNEVELPMPENNVSMIELKGMYVHFRYGKINRNPSAQELAAIHCMCRTVGGRYRNQLGMKKRISAKLMKSDICKMIKTKRVVSGYTRIVSLKKPFIPCQNKAILERLEKVMELMNEKGVQFNSIHDIALLDMEGKVWNRSDIDELLTDED